jgi:hypothetical protein
MNGEFDDLDRALRALPLEEPPAGLRDSILAATIYAPSVPALAMRFWEVTGVGVWLALAAWLGLAVISNHAAASQFAAFGSRVASVLSDTLTLEWLAAGMSLALTISFVTIQPVRVRVRTGRS